MSEAELVGTAVQLAIDWGAGYVLQKTLDSPSPCGGSAVFRSVGGQLVTATGGTGPSLTFRPLCSRAVSAPILTIVVSRRARLGSSEPS